MPSIAEIYFHEYAGGEEGERPPVVLIHGAGGNHLYWPPDIRRLPGYRVFAVDLPGHGKSGGRGQQSIEGYGEQILTWMEEFGLPRAVFVGHSMGSAIALSLALDHPEHVIGLGLVSSGARLKVAPALIESTSNPTTFLEAVETITAWSFGPEAPPQLTELAARRMAEVRPSVLHGDFLACDDFNVIDRVAEIQQPTLVVVGSEDKMTPLRFSQYLADAIPNARMEVIPGAGHMVMLEQPEAVREALLGFLDGIQY